jgi:hypothetical protein
MPAKVTLLAPYSTSLLRVSGISGTKRVVGEHDVAHDAARPLAHAQDLVKLPFLELGHRLKSSST